MSEPTVNALEVRLGEVPVGTITLMTHGMDRSDRAEFAFSDEYRKASPRPVLGQFFEDDLETKHSNRMRLPPFFSNLLPEGALRDLLARRFEVASAREFFLIAQLGTDLPGAVVVRPLGALAMGDAGAEEQVPIDSEDTLRFSLAGVQLKFSMISEGRGLTLPMRDRDGDWIAKLPHNQLPDVPENEFATMSWARAAGVEVPETRLIDVAQLAGLPEEATKLTGIALAVRRFDRPVPGTRVHIEDFAQVLGVYPSEKYKKANYETLGRILFALDGRRAADEFLRRIIFVIASGNADAHLKNWSLIYPDGISARLAPAYDLVSTIQYPKTDRRLGLNLGGSKDFSAVTFDRLVRFAVTIGLPADEARVFVAEAVKRTLDAWSSVAKEAVLPSGYADTLAAHWKSVPLLSGASSDRSRTRA